MSLIIKRDIIKIELDVLTGIHIGGSSSEFGIGGIDSPVIKNPINNQPIIPGSSLKGKLRSLLTLNKENNIDLIFGSSEKNWNEPTRIIFRDLTLTNKSKEILEDQLGENSYTEVKAEAVIDSTVGRAKQGGLRFIERVPAGVSFEGEIILNYYEKDNQNDFFNIIKKSFDLLELNYLGGSGTRGYGKVKINIIDKEEIKNENI